MAAVVYRDFNFVPSDASMPTQGEGPSHNGLQHTDQPAELDQAAKESCSSPEARTAMLIRSTAWFAEHKSRLRLRGRCTVVGCSERGALCITVCTIRV